MFYLVVKNMPSWPANRLFCQLMLQFSRWQGKRFADLPRDRQRQYENYDLRCIIISADVDRDVVFSIYQVRLHK